MVNISLTELVWSCLCRSAGCTLASAGYRGGGCSPVCYYRGSWTETRSWSRVGCRYRLRQRQGCDDVKSSASDPVVFVRHPLSLILENVLVLLVSFRLAGLCKPKPNQTGD